MKQRIKKSYICREIDDWHLQTNIPKYFKPIAGDVGVFEVLHIGKHKNIQGHLKRNISLIEGDYIMGAFGTRYATAQFEGYIPDHLAQELHILGAGGTIGLIESMHYKYEDIGPTKLRLAGMAVNKKEEVINTKMMKQAAMTPFSGAAASATRVILSLGASMDSGKTTSAAYLVHGLKKAGINVAYIKLTGTVYTKDTDLAWDLGADVVADFSDYGFPSTYMCSEDELLSLYESLIAQVLPYDPDFVVMEIADGLYERETRMLLTNYRFVPTIDSVLFSAGDSLAAINGIQILNKWGIYPAFLSGLFTASPLLIREVKENTHVPVFTINELATTNDPVSLLIKSPALASNQ